MNESPRRIIQEELAEIRKPLDSLDKRVTDGFDWSDEQFEWVIQRFEAVERQLNELKRMLEALIDGNERPGRPTR